MADFTRSKKYVKGADFDGGDIEALAREYDLTYETHGVPDADESGLYNNPLLDVIEHHRISFMTDDVPCEVYLGRYAWVRDSEDSVAVTNDSDATSSYMVVLTFSMKLPYVLPPVYVESRLVPSYVNVAGISNFIKTDSIQRVQLEGDFNRFFHVTTRSQRGVDAFQVLAPNIMLDSLVKGQNYDIEFAGDRIYVYMRQPYAMILGDGIELPLTLSQYKDFLTFCMSHAPRLARAARPGWSGDLGDNASNKPLWHEFYTVSGRMYLPLAIFAVLFLIALVAILGSAVAGSIENDKLSAILDIAPLMMIFLIPSVFVLFMAFLGIRYIQWKIRRRRLKSRYGDSEDSALIKVANQSKHRL